MVKLPGWLKRVGTELGVEASLEVCRGYLLERLREVNAEDLYEAIQNGTHTLGVAESKDKRFGKKMAKRFRDFVYEGKRVQELLTPDLVLDWLRQDLPALGSLIINMGEKGKKWLEADVEAIHRFLWGEE